MALLNLEQLRAVPALETRDVDVPELGGTVRVRAWTGADKDEWDYLIANRGNKVAGDPRGIRSIAIVVSVVDEDGNRMLTESDVSTVGAWPTSAVDSVWTAIAELNRLGAGAVEDAEKN